jgi:hypothetical protein
MDRDCYVGIVTFDDVTPESATVKEGTLQWDLDDAFKPIGDAAVELKD